MQIQSYPNPFIAVRTDDCGIITHKQIAVENQAAAHKQHWKMVALRAAYFGAGMTLCFGAPAVISFSPASIMAACGAALVTGVTYKVLAFARDINDPVINEEKEFNGLGLLHRAAAKGQVQLTKLLLLLGALPNKTFDFKKNNEYCDNTPLHMACANRKPNSSDHIKIMKMLVDAGADVNAAGSFNRCPLHLAVADRHVDRVEFLVNQGAYINLSMGSNPNESPWCEAEKYNNVAEDKIWRNNDSRSDKELFDAQKKIYTILKGKGKVYTPAT